MNKLKRVVIIGRDADAWLSALALHVFYSQSVNGITIELIELPSQLEQQDVFATLPSLKILHKMLGLNETQLLQRTQGLYAMGQRFSGWSGAAKAFLHVYDSCGMSWNNIDFIHYWLRARKLGLTVPYEDFSLGAVAAKQGNFVLLKDELSGFSNATHGFHFNALAYVKTIANIAQQAGLQSSKGSVQSVNISDNRISSITLADGHSIEADLFIDASGNEGALIKQFSDSSFEAWDNGGAIDSMLVAQAPALSPVPAYAQITAMDVGWFGLYPLADSTGIRAVYSSKIASAESVLESMYRLNGVHIKDVIQSPIKIGRRIRPWQGNCVALGHAAAYLEPLDAIDLTVLQSGIIKLLSLFPVELNFTQEAEEFNQEFVQHMQHLRDFQLCHYKLNKRHGQAFWDKARENSIPESLEHKINLFAARGEIAADNQESFQAENWCSVFIGHELIPQAYNPLVENMSQQMQMEQFQQIFKLIANEVAQMPSLQAHVDMMI